MIFVILLVTLQAFLRKIIIVIKEKETKQI